MNIARAEVGKDRQVIQEAREEITSTTAELQAAYQANWTRKEQELSEQATQERQTANIHIAEEKQRLAEEKRKMLLALREHQQQAVEDRLSASREIAQEREAASSQIAQEREAANTQMAREREELAQEKQKLLLAQREHELRVRQQQNEIEERQEALEAIAREKTKGFPWMGQKWAEFSLLLQERKAQSLERKKYPARTAAQAIRQIAAARRHIE